MKFNKVLEDIAAVGTGDVQGIQGGIDGPAGPEKKKKKKKKMVRRFPLKKSNILKKMGI